MGSREWDSASDRQILRDNSGISFIQADGMVLQQPRRNSMPVPPLTSGDRLTRAEFERRYEATPEHFKAD